MDILEIKNLYKEYSNNKKNNTLVLKGINLNVEWYFNDTWHVRK